MHLKLTLIVVYFVLETDQKLLYPVSEEMLPPCTQRRRLVLIAGAVAGAEPEAC